MHKTLTRWHTALGNMADVSLPTFHNNMEMLWNIKKKKLSAKTVGIQMM